MKKHHRKKSRKSILLRREMRATALKRERKLHEGEELENLLRETFQPPKAGEARQLLTVHDNKLIAVTWVNGKITLVEDAKPEEYGLQPVGFVRQVTDNA